MLPVQRGEGQGLSSSWNLIGPGRAKVGLWVYGCHWTGFQETVIFLEVLEESEAFGFHRLLYGEAEHEGRDEEEGLPQKPCVVLGLADSHLQD